MGSGNILIKVTPLKISSLASGAHPPSYPMGTRGVFAGGKAAGA